MHSFGNFESVSDSYQFHTQFPCEFKDRLEAFVREHSDSIRVLGRTQYPSNPGLPDGYDVIAIGDQGVKFPEAKIEIVAELVTTRNNVDRYSNPEAGNPGEYSETQLERLQAFFVTQIDEVLAQYVNGT